MADDVLMDLGIRPSAGVVHWGRAVRAQLARVRAARDAYLERMQDPIEASRDDYRDADAALHFDTHFLVIAIDHVVLFHDAIAGRLDDERLHAARSAFAAQAPDIGHLRDFYEHLDDYTVGAGRKQNLVGTAYPAPVLDMREEGMLWVRFGYMSFEVLAAGEAALRLAQETARIWFEAVNPYGASIEPLTF